MKVLLCILDGMGISNEIKGNAFYHAKKPNFDYLWNNYPHSSLEASGEVVGLPKGQMGNSEVGHTNIGAGRIVYQPLELINQKIKDESFYTNKEFLDVIRHVKENNSKLHLMGLLSDGKIHSSMDHLFALMELCKKENLTNVYYHIFLDGRDTSPTSGIKYINILEEKIKELGIGSIATVGGRYYGMDRDNRFERLKKAYDAIVLGIGPKYNAASDAWKSNQDNNITDEFVIPSVINDKGMISDNDGIIVYNYRPDRLRELFASITNKNYECFERKEIANLKVVTMSEVSSEVIANYAYKKEVLTNTLGEVISNNNLSQLRIAETEKYAHVTYFFDGGMDKELNNTKKILIDSKKVPTYDMEPSMSAYEITDNLLKEMESNKPDLIILNFANGDMVGHTGNYEAAIKAVETVDDCLGKITNNLEDYTLIVTADHGNCEKMINEDNSVNTAHTTNKVPFIINNKNIKLKDGKLSDIAPTILKIMNIDIPKEMTSNILIEME